MPKNRLLLCGLLSKVPMRSTILRRMVSPRSGIPYTDFQKMHMTAMFHTPELSKNWISYQFEKYGCNPENKMRDIRRIAQNPENRERWAHLGARNLIFIGHDEVVRYFHRRGSMKGLDYPSWCIPIINDMLKKGMRGYEIEKYLNLPSGTVSMLRHRSIMPRVKQQTGRPLWSARTRKVDRQPFM